MLVFCLDGWYAPTSVMPSVRPRARRARTPDAVAARRRRASPTASSTHPTRSCRVRRRPAGGAGARLRSQDGQAAIDFFGQRLVRRRRASYRRGDIRVRQRQSIVDALRRGDVREAGALERGHQEVARCADAVAREHPARPVRAVRGRGQPEDQHARVRIAKAGDRARPIDIVLESGLPGPAHISAIGAQPRALLAANDGVPNGRQRGGTVLLIAFMCCRCNMLQAGDERPRCFQFALPYPLEWFDCLIGKSVHIRKVQVGHEKYCSNRCRPARSPRNP